MNKQNSKQLVGEIPSIEKSEFIKVRFDEICKNISDRVEDPKTSGTDYYVGLEHLDSEDLKIHRNGTPDDVNATKLRFKKGQILFGKRRFYQRKLAVAEKSGICSAHMLVLEAIPGKIMFEFLPILMQSEEFFQRALMISEGSLSPTIKWRNLAKQEFWIPSKSDQEKIILLTDKIETLLVKNRKLFEKYHIFKTSITEELFSKGIKKSKFKEVNLEDIVKPEKFSIVDGPFGTQLHADEYVDNGIPVIRVADIKKDGTFSSKNLAHITEKKFLQLIRSAVYPGDILLAKTGATIGKLCILPNYVEKGLLASSVAKISLDKKKCDPRFVFYYLLSERGQKQILSNATGTTRPSINLTPIKKIKLTLPSKPDQQKIACIISMINEDIINTQNYFSSLKILKKSILFKKLTPQILEIK